MLPPLQPAASAIHTPGVLVGEAMPASSDAVAAILLGLAHPVLGKRQQAEVFRGSLSGSSSGTGVPTRRPPCARSR